MENQNPKSLKKPFAKRARNALRRKLWPVGGRITPAALAFFRIAPMSFSLMLARLVGRLWYEASSPDRRLGLGNMDIAFGDSLSRREKAAFCRKSFQNVIVQMMEYYKYSFLDLEERDRFLENPEELDKIIRHAEDGKGVLVLTAHLGNWELMNSYLAERSELYFLARNQKMFDHYVTDCREKYGVKTMHDKTATSEEITQKLGSGGIVVTIFDRNLRRTRGVMEKFFGREAFVSYHPVTIAVYAGVPVVPAFLVRTSRGYRLIVDEPIRVKPLETRAKTYRKYVPEMLARVERRILEYPDQWFWSHPRWRDPRGTVRTDAELDEPFKGLKKK